VRLLPDDVGVWPIAAALLESTMKFTVAVHCIHNQHAAVATASTFTYLWVRVRVRVKT